MGGGGGGDLTGLYNAVVITGHGGGNLSPFH